MATEKIDDVTNAMNSTLHNIIDTGVEMKHIRTMFSIRLEYRGYRFGIDSREGVRGGNTYEISGQAIATNILANDETLEQELEDYKKKVDALIVQSEKRNKEVSIVLPFLITIHNNLVESGVSERKKCDPNDIDKMFVTAHGRVWDHCVFAVSKNHQVEYNRKKNKFRIVRGSYTKSSGYVVAKNIVKKMAEIPEIAQIIADPKYSE
jgi:hypothetical protein